jgi:hypothetical protein
VTIVTKVGNSQKWWWRLTCDDRPIGDTICRSRLTIATVDLMQHEGTDGHIDRPGNQAR